VSEIKQSILDRFRERTDEELHQKLQRGSDREKAVAQAELDRRKFENQVSAMAAANERLAEVIETGVAALADLQQYAQADAIDIADRQLKVANRSLVATIVLAVATTGLVSFAAVQVWLQLNQTPATIEAIVRMPETTPRVEAIVRIPPPNITIHLPEKPEGVPKEVGAPQGNKQKREISR
jgi:hypothetical protein